MIKVGLKELPEPPPAEITEEQRRWRLIFGKRAEDLAPKQKPGGAWLNGQDRVIDRVLAMVYGLGGGGSGGWGQPGLSDRSQRGGRGPSNLFIPEWLRELRSAFPSQTVEVVQKDAVKLEGFEHMLLDPECLEKVEANVPMVARLLQLKHLVPEQAKSVARALVRKVVEQIEAQMKERLEKALRGPPDPVRRVRQGPTCLLDWRRTVRANMKHFQASVGTVVPERVYFKERTSQLHQKTPWEIIVLVDQSGSMGESLVYASITASVLASLRSVSTKLLLFDTNIVDMSHHLQDPVDILFGANLGGGTQISEAVAYASRLVRDPKHTLIALISDMEEGGDDGPLLNELRQLKGRGATVMCLLGMTNNSQPKYCAFTAQRVAKLDIPTFCATPAKFAELVGRVMRGEVVTASTEGDL